MTDKSTAVPIGSPASPPVVEDVCESVAGLVEDDLREAALSFSRQFLGKVPGELLEERSPDALAHTVLGAFRFLAGAVDGDVDVQVFNPDVDTEGWYAPVTVVRTRVSERPFIVDTIREFLHAQDLTIEHFVYPLMHVERDGDGRIMDVRPSREGEDRESLIHAEVAQVMDPDTLAFLDSETRSRLQDVVRATDDFNPMIESLNDVVAELRLRAGDLEDRREELRETQAFLRWLRDGAFVFLGYRAYDFAPGENGEERVVSVRPRSGLGILRDDETSSFAEPVPLRDLPEDVRHRALGGPLLIISKTNAEATVHRRARMDYIGVKRLAPDGTVVGEHRFLGLFTSRAFADQAEGIPILREKLAAILGDAGVQEGSHDFKEINTIFNSMPKEELFLASAREIGSDIRMVLTAYHTEGVRVTVREDALHRGAAIMAILPKDRFSGEVRRRIEAFLTRRYDGQILNYHLAIGSGDQARLHFFLGTSPDRVGEIEPAEIEGQIKEIIRSWTDRVEEGLEKVRPPAEARRLARRYGEALSPEYRAAMTPEQAVHDILELEAMRSQERNVFLRFAESVQLKGAGGPVVNRLQLYLTGERLILSDFVPILENCGLRVVEVSPFEVEGSGVQPSVIYSISVQDAEGEALDPERYGTVLTETVLAVRAGMASNDIFNSLVLTTGLAWREVEVLRALASYAFQLRAVPSRLSVTSPLVGFPKLSEQLFRLFEARFDPDGPGSEERARRCDEVRGRIHEALKEVTALADDRALRAVLTILEAVVRTNYYRNGGPTPTRLSGGVPYISFKISSRALQDLSRSRLLYEVWVRSPRMEGVHLRGARVARGGIRHSDRPDDFRTEVLGLVNTQMVKNSVIVPSGSKGGFVLLRRMVDRAERADEARSQYQTLIRGLLDVTDNLVEGEPVPPENIVAYDDPDPYLVVAADKGTATYSDVANEIAESYGFWLADAFASGGSHGYDHKAVGITARGGWECVKRHFREMGKDIQTEPFTVVGIGDMSGDVFGNGMLLSPAIRLVAAFDHRHVFIDPDPDPEVSFAERKRLFEMGSSSWDDYDRSKLSPGGMIVPRTLKQVDLTTEADTALGLPPDTGAMSGEDLIRAVLKAPVELFWNGGIGTYVKASYETDREAGDPSNDAVRIDATELRAAVVGEGGNLGLTQRARIEYALGGGRINTDALDNSGGVDLSDREVNLKILLSEPVGSGVLAMEDRNRLLTRLTDPIADLVLRDNESQSLAVSLDEYRARRNVDLYRDAMSDLSRMGLLDRDAEFLPSLETLQERRESHQSLTRPELSVLLAYGKLHLMGELLRGPLPSDPATRSYYEGYFPDEALETAGEDAANHHRLRREIVASQLTNDLVDLMGSAFVLRVMRETGRPAQDVAKAWVVGSRITGHRHLMEELGNREGELSVAVVYRWALGLSRVLDRTTRWVLANADLERSAEEVIEESRRGLDQLRDRFSEVVTGEDREVFESRVSEVLKHGVNETFARNLITLRFLDQILEILVVARELGVEPLEAARAYYRTADAFRIPWLLRVADEFVPVNRWELRAAQGLGSDLTVLLRSLTVGSLEAGSVDDPGHPQGVEAGRLRRYHLLLDEIEADGRIELAELMVAIRDLKGLADAQTPTAST